MNPFYLIPTDLCTLRFRACLFNILRAELIYSVEVPEDKRMN